MFNEKGISDTVDMEVVLEEPAAKLVPWVSVAALP